MNPARMRLLSIILSLAMFSALIAYAETSSKIVSDSLPDPDKSEEIIPKFAESSSVLAAQLGAYPKDFFGPRKTMDNDWATCWAEGIEGEGLNEWIKLVWLTQEIPTHAGVVPGWAKSKARWKNNPRIKTAEIQLSNGLIQTAHFEDRMALQFVELRNQTPAEWMKLVIKELYKGERFEDTSISEIKIFKSKSK